MMNFTLKALSRCAILVLGLVLFPFFTKAQCPTVNDVFINEFHYDNTGADAGEFVEVAVANSFAGMLSDIILTLYNGSGGGTYGSSHDLSTFTMGNNDGTFTYYTKLISGLQNGAPDGLALNCAESPAYQFLSYEGSPFMATNGPASGQTSTDVGASEPGSAPIGSSLQLIDGTWYYIPGFNTSGDTNCFPCPTDSEVFINEFHYDNAGGDVGEFVEIAVANSFAGNIDDITLSLYNGANGTVYGTHPLSTFTEEMNDGTFTYYTKMISGIQNGAPDGLALHCKDNPAYQFLSYEDSPFMATAGPAVGQTSTDIGASESGTTDEGSSLQLIDGVWFLTLGFNTKGDTNELPETECSISNVTVSMDGACDGSDADFQVTFDVIDGSGQYEIFDFNTPTTVYGQFLGGGGTGNFFINGTLTGPTTPGSIMVSVRDVNDVEGCVGNTVSVTIPTCPIPVVCPSVGDIIITEIMQNPSAVSDNDGEYVEVYNTTGSPIDIQGWTLRDNDSDSHTIGASVVVPANGFAVLIRNGDSGANGGITASYAYGPGTDFQLGNSTDEVVLECPGTGVIDQVIYDNGATFPDPTGASMSLDPGSFSAAANDVGTNWCESTSTYGSGDRGTPGTPNDACCAPPMAVCQNATLNLNETNTVLPDDVDGGSVAECGIASRTVSPNMFNCAQLGDNSVLLTVTDNNGDQSSCSATVTVQGLPCGYTLDDVNCSGGSSGFFNPATGAFELTSTNCYAPGYYRQTDSHAFIQSDLCSDGEIIAEVTGVMGNGWAGITMREGTGASEKMIQLVIDGTSLTRRELRTSTGGTAFAHIFQTQGRNWLRLTRTGNTFGAYHSTDGINWQPVLITNINMNSCIDIGLIVFNNSPSGMVTGTFENVAIFGGNNLQAPLQTLDIASSNQGEGVELFPNPATDELNVNLRDFIGQEVTLNILNVNGQLVKQIQLDEVYEGVQPIDVNALNNGTYLMRIESAENVVSKKFVITGK